MSGRRMGKWVALLLALSPIGCQAFCDRWAPCHDRTAYPAYAPNACCPPPQCCPPGYVPAGYTPQQQGGWAAPASVPQTRIGPNPCTCY